MNFETKVALLVRDDLLTWQGLNVAAFLATGIAGAAREAMGEPYEDAAGRRYVPLLGQPIMFYAASGADLLKARRIALERELKTAAYVAAMFATGHDEANREAFRAEPADAPDLSVWRCAGRGRTWTRRPRGSGYIRSAGTAPAIWSRCRAARALVVSRPTTTSSSRSGPTGRSTERSS